MHKLNATTANFPNWPHEQAMLELSTTEIADCFGFLSVDHVQLCPQNFGALDHRNLFRLKETYPNTKFRLHGDVRLYDLPRRNHDLINYVQGSYDPNDKFKTDIHQWFFQVLALTQLINADAITLHAGERSKGDLALLKSNAERFQLRADFVEYQECGSQYGPRIAVEGLYPVRGNTLLISSWAEYRWLLDAGISYAIDLSHLNIVAHHERKIEMSLTEELISSNKCVEVHVSANDGRQDLHLPVNDPDTWWLPLLTKINPKAVLFCESNYRSKVKAIEKGSLLRKERKG